MKTFHHLEMWWYDSPQKNQWKGQWTGPRLFAPYCFVTICVFLLFALVQSTCPGACRCLGTFKHNTLGILLYYLFVCGKRDRTLQELYYWRKTQKESQVWMRTTNKGTLIWEILCNHMKTMRGRTTVVSLLLMQDEYVSEKHSGHCIGSLHFI